MRLLIVDDEEYTREGLAEGVSWKEYGIDEIMQAGDGKAALKMAKWFQPDIVLTDIRMPKKDGFEFARELMIINSDCIIIFMSGFMEIEYLRNAIDLSAVAFIEKPINLDKVTDAVSKAVQEVNKKRLHQKLTIDNVELQKQRLANILIYKDNSREMVLRICKETDFPVHMNYNCLILWDKEAAMGRDNNLRIIQSWFQHHGCTCLCNYTDHNYYFVIIPFKNKKLTDMDNLYHKFSESNPQYTIGIGFPVADIMNINACYTSARAALNYAYYDENTKIFEIDEHFIKQPNLEPGLYNEFVKTYKNTPYQLNQWFEALVNRFAEQKYYQKEQVNSLLKSFVTTILRDHVDLYDVMEGITSYEDLDLAFDTARSIFEIKKLLLEIANALARKLDHTSKYSKVINDALNYISKRYQEADFSIQDIADYMRLSATHLNVLFKQELKVTLKQYLSNLRMEKAKALLENEHYNISEIAEMCGYTNANYFAKVFKECNNLTPLEYRKQR